MPPAAGSEGVRERSDTRRGGQREQSLPPRDPAATTRRRPEEGEDERRPDGRVSKPGAKAPIYPAERVRQGEIVLRKPWERWIFVAGLIGCILIALAIWLGFHL